ncbi:C-type lectin domain family 10 member A isoform X2 [Pleuronectes platessa]|uniref:C-type lectin domain family 10 member A isoform X2 n=2 Tax=Pleuronectes platessa TaxID=8262 RepID=UPI00232A0D17|nr:C-type lectin domain family 10 member A isoform X2 [Pleuronectes platessa]
MSGRFHIKIEKKTSPQKTTRFFFIQLQQVRKQTKTMTCQLRMKEQDESVQWIDGVSRFTRLMVPALAATVFLVLIINLGVSLSETLKQLSVTDSLSSSLTSINCSLEQILNNSSGLEGCCPPDWKLSGLSCYFFSRSALSWNDSRAWCEDHESHLVILSSDRDWDFVTHHTRSNFFWVGLSDWRTGTWEWVDQTPYSMDSRQWGPGQPDNWTGHGIRPGDEDCAHLRKDGRLNDRHCIHQMRFICQKLRGDA